MTEIQTNSGERWRPIPGYEGSYEVSDQGAIRSLDRMIDSGRGWSRLQKSRILRPHKDKDGYLRVSIGKDGLFKTRRVHALVLEAFVGPLPNGLLTRHLNGFETDCRLANLAYGTPSENNYDQTLHGTQHNGSKAKESASCPAALTVNSGGANEQGAWFGCDNPHPNHEVHFNKFLKARWVSVLAVLAVFGVLMAATITGTGVAKADGVISDTEASYVVAYGATAVCPVIAAYPSQAGVYGVAQGIMSDGFTADSAVDIINASVATYCDEYWPLLERIGAQARGELANDRMI